MKAEDQLIPDERWTIWNCHSFQEYLDRFFIPGKFHTSVPPKVKEAYLCVERLMAYSYYYYPLTEEVHSKMTRIFEMAVRIRAEELGISFKKQFVSLQTFFEAFKDREEFDEPLITALKKVQLLRNAFAHPQGSMSYGPIGYENVIAITNIINRIFFPLNSYNQLVSSALSLHRRMDAFTSGVFVFEVLSKRYLVSRLRPLWISPSEEKTLWVLYPILSKFPQTMEEFSIVKPFFIKLTDFKHRDSCISGYDTITSSLIRVVPSQKSEDINASKVFIDQYVSSEKDVKDLYESLMEGVIFSEMERFVYDEFWLV